MKEVNGVDLEKSTVVHVHYTTRVKYRPELIYLIIQKKSDYPLVPFGYVKIVNRFELISPT